MSVAALVLAVLALLLALAALGAAKGQRRALEDGIADARRTARNVGEELGEALAVQRALLARIAGGEPVTPEMVTDGQLWRDVDAAEGRVLLQGGEAVVIDVRTPQETRQGILPGALLVPIDELGERMAEIPREGAKLFYCAGGGRSAAACELLAREGYEDLHNLVGGFSAWDGPVERPG